MEKGHFGGYTGNARHSRKEEMIHDRELISDAKKQLHRADQDYKSDSPAQMNAKKGTNPIYNLSGKKGLQPSNNPAAAYMTGSPAKLHEFGHGTQGPNKGFFGQKIGTGMFGEGSFLEPAFKRKARAEAMAKQAMTAVPSTPGSKGKGANDPTIPSNDNGYGRGNGRSSNTSTPEVETPKVKTPKVKTPEKRTKINPSAKISTPKGITVYSGIGAIKTSKITSKKSTPPSAKITKAQIKANKADNKESGMSKRQIRLEKTKLKAANARYETTSDKTKAIGGKEGQRKAAKTKRLEKRASRIEGRIKKKADKKANK